MQRSRHFCRHFGPCAPIINQNVLNKSLVPHVQLPKNQQSRDKNYWAKDWLTDKLTNWLTGKFGNCKALKLRRTGELWWTTVTICMCDNCCQTGNNDNGTNNNQPGTLNCHWHGENRGERQPGDRSLEIGDWSPETPVAATKVERQKANSLAQWLKYECK